MSNPRSDIMGEMQRLPMNHKEGDKGLGIPKGRRTKAVLDPICSKIGISKTNMQEILKMLAIFQAPGKTIFQGSMQEKSFVSSIVASLYKIRKVRAKKLLNRLDTNFRHIVDHPHLFQETDPGPLGLWGSAAKLSWRRSGRSIIRRMIYSGPRKGK